MSEGANRYRVSRDADGWIVRGPDGKAVYDEKWRWNSRATARTVAREYGGSAIAQIPPGVSND